MFDKLQEALIKSLDERSSQVLSLRQQAISIEPSMKPGLVKSWLRLVQLQLLSGSEQTMSTMKNVF